MGRHAAYSGQQVTWEQALNSQVSLVPKPVDWNAKHEVPGLAIPGTVAGVLDLSRIAAIRWFAVTSRLRLLNVKKPTRGSSAVCVAAPLVVSTQADKPPDPKELARRPADPRAHRGTVEESRDGEAGSLQGHDPEHDGHLRHGSGARWRIPDGIHRRRREARRTTAAQGPARRVLDAGARGDVGRVSDVHVRRSGERDAGARTRSWMR